MNSEKALTPEVVVRVTTASGATYYLYEENHRAVRVSPDEAGGCEELPLVRVLDLDVGRPLRMVIEAPWSHTPDITWRTSPITSIEHRYITDDHEQKQDNTVPTDSRHTAKTDRSKCPG